MITSILVLYQNHTCFGKLTQTVTRFQNGTEFYALQRELFLNGSTTQISTYHLSFAYNNKNLQTSKWNLLNEKHNFCVVLKKMI